jgi:dihydroxyacetone kinase-like protein
MKKLINDPFDVVDEMLEGFLAAHSDIVRMPTARVIARLVASSPKVGIVTGGGSGHEPAFAGYVGTGLADAAAIGNVFAAPGADVCLDAIRVASSGRGVVLVYGNYAGDKLNFDLASQRAAVEGIECRTVRVSDDIASSADPESRRGIAGDVFVLKVAGAAAEQGYDLESVVRVTEHANRQTSSIGVALSPCEVPGAGRPTFELGPDEIEIGMGIHGEPGLERTSLAPADIVVGRMVETIVADAKAKDLDPGEIALLVNGLGATAKLDLYIVYRAARIALEHAGWRIARSFIGEFVTSLEMAGASITVLRLDDELRSLLDAPARSARLGG